MLHPDVVEPEFRAFCREALEASLFGALSLCAVYNSFILEDSADWKLRQLHLATEAGLTCPQTLISTSREEVEAFVDAVEARGARAVYKHASAVAAFGMPTRVVDSEARHRFDALQYAPSIIQEEVVGGPDLRIAVVGAEIFCCEWRGASPTRRFVDVKLEEGLRMRPGVLPEGLRAPLLHLQARLGLMIGVYDFKLDGGGRPLFLETNPSGQWLDMEVDGGHPISEAIARLLIEGSEAGAPSEAPRPFDEEELGRIHDSVAQNDPVSWTQVL